MKTFHLKLILILLLATVISNVWGQPSAPAHTPTRLAKDQKAVVITGARFTYPLIQTWIDEYNQTHPTVQIIIESRGTSDPTAYDILIESYEQDDAIRKTREYIHFARYPILPVANAKSAFARYYQEKGLTRGLINQIFFDDLYADKDQELKVSGNFTVYNRLQKAGAPIVFTHYFGREQKDIRGKSVAGSDEHLLKAILRDSIGVSYLPLALIYDQKTQLPVTGIDILPLDLNDNNKVTNEEKFAGNLPSTVAWLNSKDSKDLNNLPIGTLHLSVAAGEVKKDAIDFIQWVILNGQKDLALQGYLLPEKGKFEKEKAEFFREKRPN